MASSSRDQEKNTRKYHNFTEQHQDKANTSLEKLSNVVVDQHHTLDLPPQYKGSNMFMATGEQLYWQAEVIPPPHGPATCQDFEEIRSRCLSEGVLFEDAEFRKDPDSLPGRTGSVKWLRPKDIVDDPQFCVNAYNRMDIKQGYLGDCWLETVIATLTMHSNLFSRVVPDDQSFGEDYAGIFHFRFWQYGRWVDVVVDDRLPTRNKKLLFSHSSQSNEFWSPLLQKAYAKLNGSYKVIEGGQEVEAMEDFTSGLSTTYYLGSSCYPKDLFHILHKAYTRNSLLTAGFSRQFMKQSGIWTSRGLIDLHAYSITCVKYLNSETPLLRLRNPWGHDEWRGAWSDKSKEWKHISEKKKKALGLTIDEDGEFWMSFNDFIKMFTEVTVCSLYPEFLYSDEKYGGNKKWIMSMFEGKWVKDETVDDHNSPESKSRNPQYMITVTDPDEGDDEDTCTVIISLIQKYIRSRPPNEIPGIGFQVYKVEDDQTDGQLKASFFEKNDSIQNVYYMGNRGRSAQLKVSPGRYVIVPSTSRPEDAEFLLRVLTEKPHRHAILSSR